MPQFRKKPVVIDAIQFDGSNYSDCYAFCPTIFWEKGVGIIPTLEGHMNTQPNDWIIKGVKGEFYPCKDSIFRETYTETSTCAKCGEIKSVEQFYADKKRANGCHTYCIDCAKAKAKQDYQERGGATYSREQARKWRAANPRENKSLKLKHAFGITIEDYERILDSQNGVCAICISVPKPEQYLCVDHDHATGEVRGLLCHSCNKGIGFFEDIPLRLIAAARYLKPDIFDATYEPVEPIDDGGSKVVQETQIG